MPAYAWVTLVLAIAGVLHGPLIPALAKWLNAKSTKP